MKSGRATLRGTAQGEQPLVQGVHEDVAPVVDEHVLGDGDVLPRVKISSGVVVGPLVWVAWDVVGDLPGYIWVADVIDAKACMEIAAVDAVVTVFQCRVVVRLVDVVRSERTETPSR